MVAREEAEERRVPDADVVVAGESKGDAPAVAGGAGAASAFRRGPLMCACPGAWRWRWSPPAALALAREDAEVLAEEEEAGEAPDGTAPARTRDAAVAVEAVPPLLLLLGVEDAALGCFAWPVPLPPPPPLLPPPPPPLGRDQLPPSRSSSSPSGYRRHCRLSSLSSGRRAPAPSTSPAADARRRDAAVADEAAPLLA